MRSLCIPRSDTLCNGIYLSQVRVYNAQTIMAGTCVQHCSGFIDSIQYQTTKARHFEIEIVCKNYEIKTILVMPDQNSELLRLVPFTKRNCKRILQYQ